MRRAAALLGLACLTALLAAATAGAGRPGFNPVCNGTKIDPAVAGTYAVPFADGPGSVTITVESTPAGDVFDFVTDDPSHLVDTVGVKGGPAYLTWEPDASSATALHAALNPNSGKWYGLSYLCFTPAGGIAPA